MDILNFYKGKSVLVTGHTGFKGAWLCKMLTLAGAKVTGYALNPPTFPSLFEIAEIKQDITSIIDQLSEVPFTDCAKKLLYTRTNRFRQLVKTISKAEQVAKSNGIKEIDDITLKEVLKNDDADAEEIELTNENS